jgi:hypothetical protein
MMARANKRAKKTAGSKTNPWPFSRPDARRTTPASGGIAYHTSKRRPATAKKVASDAVGKKGGAFSLPDERTIQEGFKRGLSLREILAANPGLKALRMLNPAKFDRCVKAVQAKGGAANAYAVCTAATRQNIKSPRGVWPAPHEIDTAVNRRAQAMFRARRSFTRTQSDSEARKIIDRLFGKSSHVDAEARQHIAELLWNDYQSYGPKRNPAAASAEAFKEFHGFEPSEVITVTKKLFYHEHLAAAGELPFLKVWGIDERGHTIDHFKGTILCFNETMNQLFAEAGDQHINLKDFGITKPHELETLGRIVDIGYHTKKTHLGSEGGEAVYVHKFRTTNDNGKHVVVKIARYPDLIYDVRNEQLLFSGGSYEIIAEGIDK